MKNTKKIKKLNKIYLGITILLFMLISAGSIYALSYFRLKKEKVDFETNIPVFFFDRISGNNLDKKLLFYNVPILNNNQTHEIKIRHEGKLNLNGITL